MMKTLETLEAASARLTRELWSCRGEFLKIGKKECPHLAIGIVAPTDRDERAALRLYTQVATGTTDLTALWFWNDDPARTWEDIHAAFSAAIAIAEATEHDTANALCAISDSVSDAQPDALASALPTW